MGQKIAPEIQQQDEPQEIDSSIFDDYDQHPIPAQRKIEEEKKEKTTKTAIVSCFAVSALLLGMLCLYAVRNDIANTPAAVPFRATLPHTLWIYTTGKAQTAPMHSQIYLNHLTSLALQNNYQIRMITPLTVYQWLKEETIKQIGAVVDNATIDEGVHNLFKLAVMIQHGGIMLNEFDTIFLGQDFKWIENMFSIQINWNLIYQCPPNKASIYLPLDKEQSTFSGSIIAATPNNLLLKQAFTQLQGLITTANHPYAQEMGVLGRRQGSGVSYLQQGLESVLNLVVYSQQQQRPLQQLNLCQHYELQTLVNQNSISFQQQTQIDIVDLFTQTNHTQRLKEVAKLKQIDVLFKVDQPLLRKHIDHLTTNLDYPPLLPQGSLIHKILSVTGNKEVFINPLIQTDLQLCLVYTEDIPEHKIQQTVLSIEKQDYSHWKVIIPVKQRTTLFHRSEKVKMVEGHKNILRNIEQAITQHCHPQGFAILLNKGEKLEGLAALASRMHSRDAVGAYIKLQVNNGSQPSVAVPFILNRGHFHNSSIYLEKVMNHFRVISVETFRIIPRSIFTDSQGLYLSDPLPILLTLLELVRTPIAGAQMLYIAKKSNSLWKIPSRLETITQASIVVPQLSSIQQHQLTIASQHIPCSSLFQIMHNLIQNRIALSDIVTVNRGILSVEIEGNEKIPLVVHQIYLQQVIPLVQNYFLKKTRLVYPNYSIKVWQSQTISPQHFPRTHPLLTRYLNSQSHHKNIHLKNIHNLIRNQILYEKGGFWKPQRSNPLKPIPDHFRNYKRVVGADQTFKHRWSEQVLFLGTIPKHPGFKSTYQRQTVNQINLYTPQTFHLAPLITSSLQLDLSTLILPSQLFSPASLAQSDKCLQTKKQLNNQAFEIKHKQWYLLPNCNTIYPHALAATHPSFEDSAPQIQTK